MRSSSHHFTEKPIYSQILDQHVSVYRDRDLKFNKKDLTGKINENPSKGFIMTKKSAKKPEIPIKLHMMGVKDLES